MSIQCTIENHVAVVVMHHPPVNSITVGDTWKIRDTFAELDANPDVRVIILTAEGKGFNAGIDIKEMQSVEGFDHLLGSGEACYAAFHQIYETRVPVIAAVNDFCMGLGVGLVNIEHVFRVPHDVVGASSLRSHVVLAQDAAGG